MKTTTSILLIVENRLYRDEIIRLMDDQRYITVINESINNGSAISMGQIKPDIILLDLVIDQSCIPFIESLKKDFPGAKIILLDFEPGQGNSHLLFKAGVSGFVFKEATFADLLEMINSVVEKPKYKSYLMPQFSKEILFETRMTDREQQVIDLISEGLSNKDIGKSMRVSSFTVKSHIHNIMEKLSMHSRLEVANYSYSSGNDPHPYLEYLGDNTPFRHQSS